MTQQSQIVGSCQADPLSSDVGRHLGYGAMRRTGEQEVGT